MLCVMQGKRMVFNQPILEKIVERFKRSINVQIMHRDALIRFEIDEYDERFLRHLALGYTKEQISNLVGLCLLGVKSLEKRQNELVQKLFPDGNGGLGGMLHALWCVPCNSEFSTSTIWHPMKNDSSKAEFTRKRMKLYYKICTLAALTACVLQVLLIVLSWLMTAAAPDLYMRSMLEARGCAGFSAISRRTCSRLCLYGFCFWV